jgi:small-conductance mechanosensitive channel
MQEILSMELWGNTVQEYLIALAVIIGLILLIKLIRNRVVFYLKKWAAKSENTLDDFVVSLVEKNILPILNLGAFYAGFHYLTLSDKVSRIMTVIYAIFITWFLVRLILRFIRRAMESYAEKHEDAEAKKKQLRSLMAIVKAIVWAFAILVLLSNLGYNVTGIITGLGIGGIAIALAAQTILGDLFSYFVIFFDKPFEIGDFIIVDDKRGTVEKVGLKTTRIRSLTGEQLVMSNTSLTNARVHNYKQMERRRVAVTIGVTYQTSAEKLKRIPNIVKEIVTQHELATFDRTHFVAFGDFSLNFEIVYFMEKPDMVTYLDVQQEINLAIFEAFEKQGIEFAYPTQTVFVEKAAG